jgi:signal transduction histidine kinase
MKLHQQKIELQFEPPEQKILVDVNKGQILQVMLNLVLNATQAMPKGGSICIETYAENDYAHLTITDNGSGIPAGIQSDIFESFLTDRPDGTGLGLSISKRILRGHRGDIELAHSSPEGTAFHCWLPLSK